MKCWLASFPRSGNTFFRNILFYVYGVESSSWHKELNKSVNSDYDKYDFVKTHLRPFEILPNDPTIPAIYLVRDGRDSLLSMAHHRSDIVQPGSDFNMNLYEAIVADGGSHFGGWSINVTEWLERATLVIRYEDLAQDPKRVFKRVECLIDLPEPNWDNLPTFKEMKFGDPKYGGRKSQKFFRKGKSGSWREEMTTDQLDLFWHFHKDTMERLGYANINPTVPQNQLLDSAVIDKMGTSEIQSNQISSRNEKKSILIDCTLLLTKTNPPVKENLRNLIVGLLDHQKLGHSDFQFDLLFKNNIYPLAEVSNPKLLESIGIFSSKKSPFPAKIQSKRHFSKFISQTLYKLLRTNKLSYLYSFIKQVQKKSLSLSQKVRLFIESKSTFATIPRLQKNKTIRELKAPLKNDFFADKDNFSSYDIIHLTLEDKVPFIAGCSNQLVLTLSGKPQTFKELHSSNKNEANIKSIFENNSHHIITNSQGLSSEVEKLFDIKKEHISTLYLQGDREKYHHNLNPNIAQEILSKYQIKDQLYFLCNADQESAINLSFIVNSFRIFIQKKSIDPSVRLVILGSSAKPKIKKSKISTPYAKIIIPGYINPNILHVLYSSAISFINMSDTVMPPFEAMYCKTPVLFHKDNVFKEILKNSGISIEAKSYHHLAEKMELLINRKSVRDQLALSAFRQSLLFSQRTYVYKFLKIYERISARNFKQKLIH